MSLMQITKKKNRDRHKNGKLISQTEVSAGLVAETMVATCG